MPDEKNSVSIRNLLTNPPGELEGELFEPLFETPHFRLERIVSRQHATPPGSWYDQPWDEWVLLLSGSASLRFEKPDAIVELRPGDSLLIPAGRRHRVDWTDPGEDTHWLALHVRARSPHSSETGSGE